MCKMILFISDLCYEKVLFNQKLQCTHITKVPHSFLVQENVGLTGCPSILSLFSKTI